MKDTVTFILGLSTNINKIKVCMPFNDPSSNSMNTAVLCFLGTKFCFWRSITLFLWDQPEISQDFQSTEASTSFVKIWRDKGKDIGGLGEYFVIAAFENFLKIKTWVSLLELNSIKMVQNCLLHLIFVSLKQYLTLPLKFINTNEIKKWNYYVLSQGIIIHSDVNTGTFFCVSSFCAMYRAS